MNRLLSLLFAFLIFTTLLNAQSAFSLEQVIARAQGLTQQTALAKTRLNNSEWNYTSFKSGFKPRLSLQGTLPQLNRGIDNILQPDGSEIFLSRSILSTDVNLTINQVISQTGGSVYASMGLDRIEIFRENADNQINYRSSPIQIGFDQGIFAFNPYKWSKQIQPLVFEEGQKRFVEEMENIAFDAVDAFFNYYIAQLNYEAAQREKTNADSLYVISAGRFEVGRIGETDLLQNELMVKRTEADMSRSLIDLKNSDQRLRFLMNIEDNEKITLKNPPLFPDIKIDKNTAISMAKTNRSNTVQFRRRILESERELERANKDTGPRLSVSGSFGLSQSSDKLDDVYTNLLDQERIRVGFNIPIADWGASQARREITKSNLALTQIQVEQDELSFERDIENAITQFELQAEQLKLSEITLHISEKRLDLTQKRYLIGKIDVTDLNIAVNEKENARKSYISTLRTYWLSYFTIRNLTLYDFISDGPINYQSD